MYKVIDTIDFRSSWLRHDASLPQEEGILIILDFILDRGNEKVPFRKGSQVRVRKPDHSVFEREVNRLEINPAGVVGLFFSRLTATEIPRGSVIEPLG